MRLRTTLALFASLLGLVGLLAAVALIWTTSVIRDSTNGLGEAVESVRAAEELEVSLLMYERDRHASEDGAGARPNTARIDKWLARVNQHIGTEEERAVVLRLDRGAREYLAATDPARRAAALGDAVAAAEALSTLNVHQARSERADALRIDRTANALGTLVAAALLLGIAVAVALARAYLYHPLEQLRDALAAYKRGDRAHRLVKAGPEEVVQIAEEFNDMAATLAAQQQSQLQFVAGVAHDLKNPLNALKLNAEVLARGEDLPPGGRARLLLDRISKQVGRLDRMVEDLLDQSRIESGVLELRVADGDLCELATEVVELQRATAEAHQLELVLPREPVRLRCDHGRITQVLSNLLSNAIKYSPGGGRVRVVVWRDGPRAGVTVSDQGLGIPPGDLERIFEPFKRSESSRSLIPGVGLGLSVSRRIVRAHGGEITVESEVGRGSTFRVSLPG